MKTFKHSGSLGDIIFSIPCCQYFSKTGSFYLQPNVKANYYEGCDHPAGDYRMSLAGANALMPLLNHVGYQAEIYNNQAVDLDLDWFRQTHVDISRGSLPRHYLWAFEATANLSRPWIYVGTTYHNRVVVNRTSRYRNPRINYKFLDVYKPLFIGLEEEYWDFTLECPSAEFAKTNDLLEAAKIIAGSQCFISNQSVCWAIAEGLKVQRVLEVCLFSQNVIPEGSGGHDAVNQHGFEWNIRRLVC